MAQRIEWCAVIVLLCIVDNLDHAQVLQSFAKGPNAPDADVSLVAQFHRGCSDLKLGLTASAYRLDSDQAEQTTQHIRR